MTEVPRTLYQQMNQTSMGLDADLYLSQHMGGVAGKDEGKEGGGSIQWAQSILLLSTTLPYYYTQ